MKVLSAKVGGMSHPPIIVQAMSESFLCVILTSYGCLKVFSLESLTAKWLFALEKLLVWNTPG